MPATQAPYSQYFDKNGQPLDAGYVWFGLPNENPKTSPVNVYWDADLTQPASQPIRTLAGYLARNGSPAQVFTDGAYSQIVENKRFEMVYYAANSADYSDLPIRVAVITATDGQTLVNLPFAYTRGNNSLAIYLNGLLLLKDRDYTETSTTSVTMIRPLKVGPGGADEVTAIGGRLINAASAIDAVSAAALAAGSGAGLVGYNPGLTFPSGTVGEILQYSAHTVDAIRSVPAALLAYLRAGDVLIAKGRTVAGDVDFGFPFLVVSSGPANDGTVFDIGGGLFARLQYTGSASAEWFGVVADGIANDYQAFFNAVAACSRLTVPAGVIRIPFSSVSGVTPLENAEIIGAGRDSTILQFEPDSTWYPGIRKPMISMQNANLALRNLTVKSVDSAGNELFLIGIAAACPGGLDLQNVCLDGDMENTGSTLSNRSHAIGLPNSGTQQNITLDGCLVRRVVYGFFRGNSATSTQRHIRVTNCIFEENYSEDCTFNAPLGAMSDILVSGNTFRLGRGRSASLYHLHMAFASVKDFTCFGNTSSGEVDQAIHVEESCRRFSIYGNTGEVDGGAIGLLRNSFGGSPDMPMEGSIHSNHYKKAGTQKESARHGLQLVLNLTGVVPSKDLTVFGNTMNGFDRCFEFGTEAGDLIEAFANIALNGAEGFRLLNPASAFCQNTSKGCDVGIVSVKGGVAYDHCFISCVTNVDAQNRFFTVVNPRWVIPPFDLAVGANRVVLTSAGATDRAFGTITIQAQTNSADQDTYTYVADILWNGTAWSTPTVRMFANGGGHIEPAAALFSSNVVANLFNGAASARLGGRMDISLAGSLVVGV